MSVKRVPKVHYMLTGFGDYRKVSPNGFREGIGVCGYTGAVTKDEKKVTCKFCKKMLKSGKYLG